MDERVSVVWCRPDGSPVVPGDVVAEVAGPLRPILTAERTALNFLGHLSGVATLTRQFVDAVAAVEPDGPGARHPQDHARAAGPGEGGGAGRGRPQPPGQPFRRRAGQGQPPGRRGHHRGGARARALWPGRMVEVECDRPDQVVEACRAGADRGAARQHDARRRSRPCAALARRAAGEAGVLVEVSGGIDLRHRAGLRRGRGGPDLGGGPDPLGAGPRPGARSA